MNAHRMLGAITAAVVVVAAVTSSVTHTMLASDIRRSINDKSRRLDRRITVKISTSAAPTVLGVSTGCLCRPSKNLADILRLQSLRDRRFLARTLTR